MTAEQLEQVSNWLDEHAASAILEWEVRAAFSEFHFTFCSDDDVMADTPAAVVPGYHLYLVDSTSHCLCLTSDMACASGFVVATVEQD